MQSFLKGWKITKKNSNHLSFLTSYKKTPQTKLIMKTTIFIFFSVFLGLVSCKKAELKKPTTVSTVFGINTDDNETIDLEFETADLTLQNFRITGKRIDGPNIDFNRILDNSLNIDLDGTTSINELEFDIPQGEYTELIIEFNSTSSSYSGEYKLSNGPKVDVIFELSDTHLFQIICEYNNQTDLIELDKNVNRIIDIELNCKNWFNSLSSSQLDNADLTNNNNNGLGNSSIIINSSNNISLYNIILTNITLGNKASFN